MNFIFGQLFQSTLVDVFDIEKSKIFLSWKVINVNSCQGLLSFVGRHQLAIFGLK